MNNYSSVIMRIKQAMEGDKKLRQRMAAVEKLLISAKRRLDPFDLLKRRYA
jgi:hypothetical protein